MTSERGEGKRRRSLGGPSVPAIVAAGFLLVGCRGAVTPPADPLEQLAANFKAALERLLEEQRAQIDLAGATAAFALPDGRVIGVAAGEANREIGLPMKPHTRMLAGSVGKTYASALFHSMVANGELAFGDRLADYLGDEDWYQRLPNGSTVTLEQLLHHASGLHRYVLDPAFRELRIAQREAGTTAIVPPRQLIEFVLDEEPLFPAGGGYSYSDTNYLLVGLVMEKVGGFELGEEIVRRFLSPLGLTLTGPQKGLWHPGLAQGYSAEGSQGLSGYPPTMLHRGLFRWDPYSEWAGGGFISTSEELARWGQLLWSGRAMKDPYLEDMVGRVNPHTQEKPSQYALGVSIEDSPEYGRTYGHGGVYPGYGTSVAYYADHGVAVAVQVNATASGAARAIQRELVPLVLAACADPSICPEGSWERP